VLHIIALQPHQDHHLLASRSSAVTSSETVSGMVRDRMLAGRQIGFGMVSLRDILVRWAG
jgi:hypothetical protein